RPGREATDGAVAVPEAPRVGLVFGFAVAPPDLQHQRITGRVGRGRDPGALPAREIRVAELEPPLRCDLLDLPRERGQPLHASGIVVLIDRVRELRRNLDRGHAESVASGSTLIGV